MSTPSNTNKTAMTGRGHLVMRTQRDAKPFNSWTFLLREFPFYVLSPVSRYEKRDLNVFKKRTMMRVVVLFALVALKVSLGGSVSRDDVHDALQA